MPSNMRERPFPSSMFTFDDVLETPKLTGQGFGVCRFEHMKMNSGCLGSAAVLVPPIPGYGYQEGQLLRFLFL
jgi:hypothetical protein